MSFGMFITLGAFIYIAFTSSTISANSGNLVVYTVATDYTDGLHRLLRSARIFNYNLTVLGMGEKWTGGDVAHGAGGGQKVNILSKALSSLCANPKSIPADLVVMFVDAYDVIFVTGPNEVVDAFATMKANIVFSAEPYCWPDKSLQTKYPIVKEDTEYPYLCSGGFIGFAKSLCDLILPRTPLPDDASDDQLFYTQLYLDEAVRASFDIKLDTRANIFQNAHGTLGDFVLRYVGVHSQIYNTKLGTSPKVLHGNGPASLKVEFNRLTDYIPDNWSPAGGCISCAEEAITLDLLKPENTGYPIVALGLFIETPTPFLGYFFQSVEKLNYPKDRLAVFLHSNVPYHEPIVTEWLTNTTKLGYIDVKRVASDASESVITEADARDMVIDFCESVKCDYVFELDSIARIRNEDTLVSLIERNRTVIAPMLKRADDNWSNFWGAININGYYRRSEDYLDIVKGVRKGLWNVPYITNALLIKWDRLKKLKGAWSRAATDPDLAFCNYMREKYHFMYVDNTNFYGHLINPDFYNTTRLHPDLWEVTWNRVEWEQSYISPDYWKVVEAGASKSNMLTDGTITEPCTDVYNFPAMTPLFCKNLVEEMEHYGQWSNGKNTDPRLAGGYENVPTVDIHMRQINFETEWLHFLKTYVGPLAKFAYTGFEPECKATMNFVVRYHPREQDRLRPHFDSSTFSINIALTRLGVDYEGGGTHFVRYNCSIKGQPLGWLLMHPGRLTHWHEGLPVTKGTRYIAISFVDP